MLPFFTLLLLIFPLFSLPSLIPPDLPSYNDDGDAGGDTWYVDNGNDDDDVND